MKILTVRQPWAWAIMHGKDVENRSQNIAGDYRGPVAIHAAKREVPNRFERGGASEQIGRITGCIPLITLPSNLGTIIGVVNLVDVHAGWIEGTPCSPWAQRYADHNGLHHLVLENPRALATPIPYTGALGLRDLPADVDAQIREQLPPFCSVCGCTDDRACPPTCSWVPGLPPLCSRCAA
ncbi:hypothetical protein LGT39_12530 [Demequina sp. TTPB684]|uniref:hypothetical protein n=1 Tax=unclassified Demequina TaxID=2620311 RepID=UPI001CF3D5A5|nr:MULTISPECIES: hypothetical protein [unclassified Demequina]MCB2413671.1 hypothetical protein [Demequina sp. TTPB684]UPU87733.1 hypothetical protein LGT36_010785 [Demequina sp. TMPB413]